MMNKLTDLTFVLLVVLPAMAIAIYVVLHTLDSMIKRNYLKYERNDR